MTLLYQLIPAEGAKPRGKMPQGAQQARADAECGEEDLHLGRTRCKACPGLAQLGDLVRVCGLGTSSVKQPSQAGVCPLHWWVLSPVRGGSSAVRRKQPGAARLRWGVL